MKKISVIYWSGTGNTEQMAEAVAEGARQAEAEVKLIDVERAKVEDVLNADAVALGCPAMGAEGLEEDEMEPFVETLEKVDIKNKPMILFGSFDWGDGEWMREWIARMGEQGVQLLTEGFIVQDAPGDSELDQCRELGKKLASI